MSGLLCIKSPFLSRWLLFIFSFIKVEWDSSCLLILRVEYDTYLWFQTRAKYVFMNEIMLSRGEKRSEPLVRILKSIILNHDAIDENRAALKLPFLYYIGFVDVYNVIGRNGIN